MQNKYSLKYIALSLLMTIVLTLNVGFNRMEAKKTIGFDKGTKLERAIRSHANFLEYTPIFLVALTAAELVGACVISTNVLGLTFLTGRVLHALSLNYFEPVKNCIKFRQISMMMTLIPFLLLALFLIVKSCRLCCFKEENEEKECIMKCKTKKCTK